MLPNKFMFAALVWFFGWAWLLLKVPGFVRLLHRTFRRDEPSSTDLKIARGVGYMGVFCGSVVLIQLLLGLLILAVAAGGAFGQTVKRPFALQISVASTTIRVGSPITIKIELKNISDHNIGWTMAPGWESHGEVIGFTPIVRDEQGKEPPLTKWGRRVLGRGSEPDDAPLVRNAAFRTEMAPGKVMNTEIGLDGVYDLRAPGKYNVQVSHYDEDNKEDVKSNTLTITITP
jgi:hypothetical protein